MGIKEQSGEMSDVTESYETDISKAPEDKAAEVTEDIKAELEGLKDKYLRLCAEFENYKKKVQKDRDELIRYSTESLIYELLSVIDSMEMALKHSEDSAGLSSSLVKGVENTVRELNRILEKSGLTAIEAMGKPFDPAYHHAMTQVEADEVESNTVVEEYRKGYIYGDKVLRPSLVAVSKKTVKSND
ncbi:MAG: nucleotide exchange factor GrpE [Thermodesulfovibrionales bacterium]|nr:nucleotide exchange factor GrpE [Thermodesulfovibrionales bacterium]